MQPIGTAHPTHQGSPLGPGFQKKNKPKINQKEQCKELYTTQRAIDNRDFYLLFMGKPLGGYLKLVLSSVRVVRELHRKQFCNSFLFSPYNLKWMKIRASKYIICAAYICVGVCKCISIFICMFYTYLYIFYQLRVYFSG